MSEFPNIEQLRESVRRMGPNWVETDPNSMFCDSNDATVDAHPHHVPCPECARVFKQLYAVLLDMERRRSDA